MKQDVALQIVRNMCPPLDQPRAPAEAIAYVYFVKAGDFVKIGKSLRWKERIADMQTGSPHEIVPLIVLISNPSLERRLHRRFRSSHFRGEWFHLSDAIKRYIENNRVKCIIRFGSERLVRPNEWGLVK